MRAPIVTPLLALLLIGAGPAPKAKPPAPPVPLGEPIAIGGCSDCETWPPVVVGSADGQALLAWRLLHDDSHLVLDLYGPDGGPSNVGTLSGDTFIGYSGGGADGDGWLVGWNESRSNSFFLQRAVPGAGVGGRVLLNPDRLSSDVSSFVVVGHGRVLLLWSRIGDESGPSELLAQVHDGDGQRLTAPTKVADSFGRTSGGGCLRADGTAVVAWTLRNEPLQEAGVSPAGVAFRFLGADGVPASATTVVAPVSSAVRPGFKLACAADGSFALLWSTSAKPAKQGRDIVWQRYDRNGRARGKAALVNSRTAGEQTSASALLREDGSYLFAWQSDEGGGRIVARRFTAAGKARGSDVLLEQAPEGTTAESPALAAAGPRTFGLAWWRGRVGMLRWFSG